MAVTTVPRTEWVGVRLRARERKLFELLAARRDEALSSYLRGAALRDAKAEARRIGLRVET